ncbi:MAG: serine protease, partial [Candidatus Enterosoma sp.]|nr:serine protease [Candidatus Enterosoma sp.]
MEHDWGVIELDRPLGNTIGWPRKITNWYELNAEIYSWRYPADKPRGTLWKTVGRIKKEEHYRYYYDFDSYGGQSGSPIFMTGS